MAEESTHNPNQDKERIGKYEILRHIASGGMGAVYKARDCDLDRLVALKILPVEMAKQEKTILRFRREAQAAARLRHENIVAIFDVGEHAGTYFIALEFIEGVDLQEYINRKCRLDPEEARQIMIQATRALVHAHEQGIVHRDIKPSNFLLTIKEKHVHVKLTDFGLAIRNENDEQFRITRDGTTVGTVDYMSPEQARNSQAVDIRSDIYSLGCTFFHMLGGIAPFARGSLPERIVQHMQKAPPDVRRLNKLVPESFVIILNRMLAKKPDERYQTPAELLHELTNHPKINPPGRRAETATSKPSEGVFPNETVDPTAVLENKEIESTEPKPPRTARPKKIAEDPAEQQDAEEQRSRVETKKTRTRREEIDEEDDPRATTVKAPAKKDRTKKSNKTLPLLLYGAVGAVGLLGMIAIVVIIVLARPTPPKIEPPPVVEPEPVVVAPPKKSDKPAAPVIDTSPWLMSAGPLPYTFMEKQFGKVDPAALRKEYHGPFLTFPEAPEDAKTLQVSRIASGTPNSFRTLADALEQTAVKGWTIIEINDDGPIYLPSLPALSQRNIVLRGAAGFRPLLAWDAPKSFGKEKAAPALLPISQGKLVLANLDVVARWDEEQPTTLFALQAADFYARDCTFSLSGKSTQSIAIVNLQEFKGDSKENRAAQVWLQRCYVRGPHTTLLRTAKSSATLLLQESLVAGQNQPLVLMHASDEDVLQFHCVRSTLVTGQVMLRCQGIDGKKSTPQVRSWILDSILSRDDAAAPLGDLIQLAPGTEPSKMRWKTESSVYAGWKKLLACDGRSIGGDDLEGWHRLWNFSQGDRAVLETWPSQPVVRLAEAPAHAFLPLAFSPLAYQALSGPGAIGCVIGWLPQPPESWKERSFEPPTPPIMNAGESDPPAIKSANDGFYHGEKIDLNKTDDLGAYLKNVLLKATPAPRVVLHLTGKGLRQTSSIRITGIKNLVLYFEPPQDPKDTVKLSVNPSSIGNRTPLIEIIDGNLEMIGARIQLSPITFLPTMIRVQDGDLTLTRCWLQGPLVKSPEAFASLIAVSNSSDRLAAVSLRDNVLLSGKLLLHLQGQVQLKARNNLFVSLGDGMRCEAKTPFAAVAHVLDHNTWAVRQTTFALPLSSDFLLAAPTRIYANSNAFLNPFAEETNSATLMRVAESSLAHGQLIWQGRYNVYDARLQSYLDALEKPAGDKQTLKDWQQTWGTMGERESALFETGPPRKTIPLEGSAAEDLLLRLDRLALPRQLRGDPAQASPGADLFALRITTKKG